MTYEYVEGDLAHSSGDNGVVTRVVIHATVSPCEHGGALNVAHYFQRADAGGLAHYVVDPGQVVQCCHEDVNAWHAPPNHGSIGVELCDPQTGDAARWGDADHVAMLQLAAQLVADICARHAIPVAYVDAAALRNDAHGITTHADVSAAWHESDHSDPGAGFPMEHFVELVRAASAPAAKPAPAPAPAAAPHGVPSWYKRVLRLGSHGDDVRALQRKLGAHADGIYGPLTRHAVVHFQQTHHGLAVDGVVGPATATALGN